MGKVSRREAGQAGTQYSIVHVSSISSHIVETSKCYVRVDMEKAATATVAIVLSLVEVKFGEGCAG